MCLRSLRRLVLRFLSGAGRGCLLIDQVLQLSRRQLIWTKCPFYKLKTMVSGDNENRLSQCRRFHEFNYESIVTILLILDP